MTEITPVAAACPAANAVVAKNKARAAVEKKKLLRLVMTVLRGGKRRRTRGIDQGGRPGC